MKLIVGLGNPGLRYADNRHNIGFICLNRFAKMQGIRFDSKQGQARTGTGEINGKKIVLAKPQTFMNASGESVSRLVQKFKIEPVDLMVIHDDLDLPLGKIRIRRGGSSAGHKGIESIINELGSQGFIRVRIGIGRPNTACETDEADIIDYVLDDFGPDEKKIVIEVIPRVSEAILCLLNEGLTAAMNKYN
ncbi:MAG: aminoacyl-tRNA hydrolase [Chloroflexi bacterium]|nr:aminoacyl-tRNA hydrolase [Chloroflexota bacterium]